MASQESSFWHSTCSAIRAGEDPTWAEIGDYEQPLALLLAMRYRWLRAEDREDLVQQILLELRQGLTHRYQVERGRFRAFLRGVVHNKVLAHWKRSRKTRPLEDLGEPAAFDESEDLAVDVGAQVVGAVRRWHDRWAGGDGGDGDDADADPTRVYVLAGRLLRGETYAEIAEREGLSTDAVKRHLSSARAEIAADLLEHALALPDEVKAGLDWKAISGAAREALRDPVNGERALAAIGQERVRQAVREWVEGYRRAVERLRGSGDADEMRRGVEEVLTGA